MEDITTEPLASVVADPEAARSCLEVFAVTELLEKILFQLDPIDIIATRSVSRVFLTVINGSDLLLRHIYLNPDHRMLPKWQTDLYTGEFEELVDTVDVKHEVRRDRPVVVSAPHLPNPLLFDVTRGPTHRPWNTPIEHHHIGIDLAQLCWVSSLLPDASTLWHLDYLYLDSNFTALTLRNDRVFPTLMHQDSLYRGMYLTRSPVRQLYVCYKVNRIEKRRGKAWKVSHKGGFKISSPTLEGGLIMQDLIKGLENAHLELEGMTSWEIKMCARLRVFPGEKELRWVQNGRKMAEACNINSCWDMEQGLPNDLDVGGGAGEGRRRSRKALVEKLCSLWETLRYAAQVIGTPRHMF